MMTLPLFVAQILRYFVGLLLLAAGVAKLRGFARFRDNLIGWFGIGGAGGALLAPAVVLAELVAAALVLGGARACIWTGMWLALCLFLVFTALLGYKFYTQSVVHCGCFGDAGRSLSGFDLLRNVLVIAAIGAGLALGPPADVPLHAAILAAALASIACVVAIHFHAMVMLLAPSHG